MSPLIAIVKENADRAIASVRVSEEAKITYPNLLDSSSMQMRFCTV